MLHNPSLSVKAFASPTRYYQGPDITRLVAPDVFVAVGRKPLVIGGPQALGALRGHGLARALEEKGVTPVLEEFGSDQPWGRECCDEEVNRLIKIAELNCCDTIIGAGGGKAIDTGKAVSDRMRVPMISYPTTASTDAPTSSLSVMYTPGGRFKEYRFYSRAPDAVLVDTAIISEAPARYLACGIGDALSKKFEVEACYTSGHENQIVKPVGGRSPLAGLGLSDLLYEILWSWGRDAMMAARRKAVTAALEAVVEGAVLISGLAFESGGLAAAHSVYDGLTLVEAKMRPHQYHGELVHFGTCVQLVLEGRPRDLIHDVFTFGHEIGLPETFEEIGLKEIEDEDLWKVAEKTAAISETIHKMAIEVTPQKVFDAMKVADGIGKTVSRQTPRALYA